MPQPNSPHIISTPEQPGKPYDATFTGVISGWATLDQHAGPVSLTSGRNTGEDFPSSGSWQQT